ncbi:MAG: DNA-binding domain-containing protein, partial [Bacteroidia bacterium]|nr:DNA-binding domain-containing protein [Bacteroidia bacterium]
MLKYTLQENLLTERSDDFMAQTIATRAYTKEDVITLILRRGTLLTRTDVLAAMNGVEEAIADIVRDGGTVNLPLFNTSFSISGVFEGPMDTFD